MTYRNEELPEIYRQYAELKGWSTHPKTVDDKVANWIERGLGAVGLAIEFFETGKDNYKQVGHDAEQGLADAVSAGGPKADELKKFLAHLPFSQDRFEVVCGMCGNRLKVRRVDAGRNGRCSKCGTAVTVPEPTPAQNIPPPIPMKVDEPAPEPVETRTVNLTIPLLETLQSGEFQQWTEEYLHAANYSDVRLRDSTSSRLVYVAISYQFPNVGKHEIQIRRNESKKVGVAVIRELIADVELEAADFGVLITTSDFTWQAKDLANGMALTLLDGEHWLSSCSEASITVTATSEYFESMDDHFGEPALSIPPVVAEYPRNSGASSCFYCGTQVGRREGFSLDVPSSKGNPMRRVVCENCTHRPARDWQGQKGVDAFNLGYAIGAALIALITLVAAIATANK